ncbi:MAG: hypothetical protein HY654_01755 [Acidobacteria bacterium]|nr:hypothetical protein [Acidobacteriota bacterium]
MDDKFLYDMRTDPPPAFAGRLRARLMHDPTASPRARSLPLFRLGIAAASVAGIALLLALPPVRASAQAFLDLFRVVNFTPVPVGEDRIRTLESDKIDLPRLIGEQVQVITEPGMRQSFQSREAASAAAGFRVRLPALLRPGLTLGKIELEGERAARVTGSTAKLRHVLEALEIRDVRVPQELDGQTATVRVPPMVHVAYKYGEQTVDFVQGRSPIVTMPEGIDLPMLGEIGLRILGLDSGEARRLAQAIDWRSTLLVPVPATASSLRQVDVRGHRALLIEMAGPPREGETRPRRLASLMWSEGDQVYAMKGPLRAEVLLEMANSLE